MENDWKTQTYALSWLRKQASDHAHLRSAEAFLRAIGVVPEDVDRLYQRNVEISTSLPKAAIPAKYLATMAHEWDNMGPSSPVDYIHALSFECAGTQQRDVVAETLAALGALLYSDGALASDDAALAA